MFGGLKEKAAAKGKELAMAEVEKQLGGLASQLEILKTSKPSDIQDDTKFHAVITTPVWNHLRLASGDAISMAQKFIDLEGKFKTALLHVRDELIMVEGEKVNLHLEFQQKLVPTIMASIKS